ncbi:UNVERIFIED_CONTAM: Alpha/beta hydrolase domain-containing protein WAV2 [Sesamum radiatum]|uniref:Alpha/beta hydrolase domain-containing protein WAV2 n=1 Tax=Sesamum radiatum TaxID=300843 RepID=A0AAW2L9F7_SESRA
MELAEFVMAGMALLVTFQEKLIYVPVLPGLSKSYPITPARFRLLYEDVWLTSSDGVRLHSWFIKPFPDFRGVADISRSCRNLVACVKSIRGFELLCYGASAGFPSQHGITLDAQAALDHLVQRTDIDTSRIVVFGRSLGGAVGAVVTRNNPDQVAALILENTFTSILDMAGVAFPFLKWFIGSSSKGLRVLNFVVRSPWSTIDVIDEIKQPVLFLSGLQDEIVPPSHMEMLYVKAAAHNQQCLFVEFPTGKHMDTWLVSDRYWTTIQEFLEKNVPDKKDRDSSRVGKF